MPTDNPLTFSFIPIAVTLLAAALVAVGILVISWLLGGGRTSHAGETVYECGLEPMDDLGKRFSVKFYVVAMLFILFDVEVALLVPWAVLYGHGETEAPLRLVAFFELLVFLAILVVGYVYLYKAGAFDWHRARGRETRDADPGTAS